VKLLVNINNLMNNLDTLYHYGEIKNNIDLQYLIDQNFIRLAEDRLVITKKWIKFSNKVNREDFITSLLCFYPSLLHKLLQKIYREACIIGQRGDGKALYEFIDSIPGFAETMLNIKDKDIKETEEIKSFFQVIFNGYPQYPSILAKLRIMQLAEEAGDIELTIMGNNPNEIWIKGRKVTSSINLLKLKDKNRYTFTPYYYKDFPVEEPVGEVLSYPWKSFVTILTMVALEYQTAGFEGLSIRPTDYTNYYTTQSLDFYIFNSKGREVRVGRLNDFVYEFCIESDIYLFPDKAPEVDKVVFDMMNEQKIDFKDGEYVLNEMFKDLIYSKDIIIKNRSRKFKNALKDYIEKLRNTL
jgi:hypothetical protein